MRALQWCSLRWLAGCALLLWLSACSTTGFFYNRLDSLIPWYLQRYVQLNAAQRALVDAEVRALLAWHRSEELPRYVALLDSVLVQLDAPVTAEVIAALTERTEAAWLRLRDRALPSLLKLGETLDAEQVAALLTELEERQRELEEEYLPRSDAEYREEARDSMARGLRRYLGRLDAAQKQTIEEASAGLLRADQGWLDERRRAVATLRTELSARAPGWQQSVVATLDAWWQDVPEDYRAVYDHNAALVRTAVAAVIDARDARQDARLRRKLRSLRDELADLLPAEPEH
jgi:hypothetical protein